MELVTRPVQGHADDIDWGNEPGTFPAGRRCVEPGCITFLCHWNPGPRCYVHEHLAAERRWEVSRAA